MKKFFTSLLLCICLLSAINVLGQGSKGYTHIEFTDFPENFNGDTTWTVDNIDFEIEDGEKYEMKLCIWPGTFKTSFDNFDFAVYNLLLNVDNYCPDCFEITLYKAGEDPVIVVPPLGQNSTQDIVNPWWPDNPDFLEVWTNEGCIVYETIYHNAPVGQIETEVNNQPYLSPNPAVDFITINQLNKGSVFQIYNSVGELIEEFPGNSNDQRIDISSYYNGMYFIAIINGTKIQTLKFIKPGNK